MDRYDKVDPELIIEKLKRLIQLLEAEQRSKNSNEKNISSPL